MGVRLKEHEAYYRQATQALTENKPSEVQAMWGMQAEHWFRLLQGLKDTK